MSLSNRDAALLVVAVVVIGILFYVAQVSSCGSHGGHVSYGLSGLQCVNDQGVVIQP